MLVTEAKRRARARRSAVKDWAQGPYGLDVIAPWVWVRYLLSRASPQRFLLARVLDGPYRKVRRSWFI